MFMATTGRWVTESKVKGVSAFHQATADYGTKCTHRIVKLLLTYSSTITVQPLIIQILMTVHDHKDVIGCQPNNGNFQFLREKCYFWGRKKWYPLIRKILSFTSEDQLRIGSFRISLKYFFNVNKCKFRSIFFFNFVNIYAEIMKPTLIFY